MTKSGPGKIGRPARIKDKHCVLALLRQYYSAPAEQKTWSELFGLAPSTISRYIRKAEVSLHACLLTLHDARIEWPSLDEQRSLAEKVENKNPLVMGRWGFIDGKNYHVQEPSDFDTQNAMYNGWLHSVLISNSKLF